MSQEVIIYGRIDGPPWRPTDEDYRRLQHMNAVVIYGLPLSDVWPCLIRGMFAVPAPWPYGTFRTQVIPFAASFKSDDAFHAGLPGNWVDKFEALLRRLFWSTAVLHAEVDGGPPRTWRWRPTADAAAATADDPPRAVREWVRTDPGDAVVNLERPTEDRPR